MDLHNGLDIAAVVKLLIRKYRHENFSAALLCGRLFGRTHCRRLPTVRSAVRSCTADRTVGRRRQCNRAVVRSDTLVAFQLCGLLCGRAVVRSVFRDTAFFHRITNHSPLTYVY